MSKFVNIAVVQMASPAKNQDFDVRNRENIAAMEAYIDMICHLNPTVEFILFPELAVQSLPPDDLGSVALTIPGPITDVFCKKAKEHGVWILPGSFIEKRDGVKGTLNTAVLISPDGEIALKHSKVFIPYPLESSEPGSDFEVLDIPGIGKVGILICADLLAPEPARNLALKGAEIIFKPTFHGFWGGDARTQEIICQTRAMENQCYIVNIGQATPLGMGHSCVCHPDGYLLDNVGTSETFFIATLNLDEVRRVREYGSHGIFPYMKILKEVDKAGSAITECYTNGVQNAPLYRELKGDVAKYPYQMRKFDE